MTHNYQVAPLSRPLVLSVLWGCLLCACTANTEKQQENSKENATVAEQSLAKQHHLAAKQKTLPFQYASITEVTKPFVSNRHRISSLDVSHSAADDTYQYYPENRVWQASANPLSTFSIDVDTASYSNIRSMLRMGEMPPADAVRIEEFINYFDYNYDEPSDGESFSVRANLTESPYDDHKHIMRIAIQGKTIPLTERKSANLVFLIDVSGSMSTANKLPLLKRSLKLLVPTLSERDTISIVIYAGAASIALPPTPGDNEAAIYKALDDLASSGETNGAEGIELAYQLAYENYKEDAINSVLLATDGDFNVGVTDNRSLLKIIEHHRTRGVSLSVLGFGNSRYNDHLTEQLADNGDGTAYYIDGFNEAKKVLLEQMTGTLQTIAKDVKIQVEFNPRLVKEYRLIGYENRKLRHEDFNNDRVDAGEIGAGHKVTALYEISLVGSEGHRVDVLRYSEQLSVAPNTAEVAVVKLRYKSPHSDTSSQLERIVRRDLMTSFDNADPDFKFAISVAGFAEMLKHSKYLSKHQFEAIIELCRDNGAKDKKGYRNEFWQLVENWQLLTKQPLNDVYTQP